MKAFLILLAIIALPIAEIWLALWLAEQYGWSLVFIAAAAFFGFGLAMMQRAGYQWRRNVERAQTDQAYLQSGFGAAMGDAALIFIGGILMIIPGFITGVVGLLLVIPPIRHLISRLFRGKIESAAAARGTRNITIIEGETVNRESSPDASDSRPRPPVRGEILEGEIVDDDRDSRS